LNPLPLFAQTYPITAPDIVGQIVKESLQELEMQPLLYPHYLIFGVELEATLGVSSVAELGSSLSIELHFERIIK
jgi:hypothetical protein